jgi:hypothetical protein
LHEIKHDGFRVIARITRLAAMGAAQLLKRRNPNHEVAVRDMQTGEVTVGRRQAWKLGKRDGAEDASHRAQLRLQRHVQSNVVLHCGSP